MVPGHTRSMSAAATGALLAISLMARPQPAHRRRPFEEAGQGAEHLRLLEQEGVVALVALDLDEGDVAATAFSAWTIARFSRVGNSQSLVKEIRQKRVGVPLKALAKTPPWASARSK